MPEVINSGAEEVTAPSAEQLEIERLRSLLDLYRHAFRTVDVGARLKTLDTIKCWAPRQYEELMRDLAANS